MADRVRMKSKSTFDNPFIYNHEEVRLGRTTVQDGDEFSTEEEHAVKLEQVQLAERVSGDVSDRTDRQEKLIGTQKSAGNAVQTKRETNSAAPAPASGKPVITAGTVPPSDPSGATTA